MPEEIDDELTRLELRARQKQNRTRRDSRPGLRGEDPALAGGVVDPPEPITHTNRRGEVYYLHSGVSKTGKPTYHFSRKEAGNPVYEIPGGFEVYENPDARVYPRRIPKKIVSDEERRIVEAAMEAASVADYIVEVKKDAITVFLGDLTEDEFTDLADPRNMLTDLIEKAEKVGVLVPDEFRELISELAEGARAAGPKPAELLEKVQTYSPMLRFTLQDKETRSFDVERAWFTGGEDEWLWLDGPAGLRELASKYCRHLEKDSFYDLC